MKKFYTGIVIFIILMCSLYVYIGDRIYQHVKQVGLKEIVSDIWEGEQ